MIRFYRSAQVSPDANDTLLRLNLVYTMVVRLGWFLWKVDIPISFRKLTPPSHGG